MFDKFNDAPPPDKKPNIYATRQLIIKFQDILKISTYLF